MKNTLEQSCKGRPWQCVLAFARLCNFNRFPFNSGAAFRQKQWARDEYMPRNTFRSESFQQIKFDFADDVGMPCNCDEEERHLFAALGKMRSFSLHGPCLKLQNWVSLNRCWDFYKRELHGLKLILGEMLKLDTAVAADALKVDGGPPIDDKVTALSGTVAWGWLQEYFGNPYWRCRGVAVDAAWRAKLVPVKRLLCGRDSSARLVLASCAYGLLTWATKRISTSVWVLAMDDPAAISWYFVCSVDGLTVIDVTPEFDETRGIVFKGVDPQRFVAACLATQSETETR